MNAPFHSRPASRSVSGKRVCSCCHNILGKGAAMIIESLGLCYHLHCFKVRLSQTACNALLGERMASLGAGCGPATNKLGAASIGVRCTWNHKWPPAAAAFSNLDLGGTMRLLSPI